jgi:serpin B
MSRSRSSCVCLTLALAVASLSFATNTALAEVPPEDVKAVVGSINAFALDLYAQLAKTTSGNLFLSPYSIETALAMTYAGAGGETAEQMRRVLHFTLPDDRLHAAFAKLSADLPAAQSGTGRPPIDLVIANGLWGRNGYPYNGDFIHLVQEYYGADLHAVDFASAPDQARQIINEWVAQKTRNKFRNLLGPGILNSSVRFVLVNAIYLKAPWATAFDAQQTVEQAFHLDERSDVTVPLMCGYHFSAGMENASLKAVDLPYEGFKLSMVILLPSGISGIRSLERQLNCENLDRWINQIGLHDITVYLPRFTVNSECELTEVLAAMGMPNAFDQRANFSGVTTAESLHLNDVVHRSYLNLNEKGTEAAAASVATGGAEGGPGLNPAMTFKVDHPFFFIIRDNETGVILFIGRVMNPAVI